MGLDVVCRDCGVNMLVYGQCMCGDQLIVSTIVSGRVRLCWPVPGLSLEVPGGRAM